MSLERYRNILQEVNIDIGNFNEILMPEFRIPQLCLDSGESVSTIANVPWNDQKWPCSDFPGVYLLCGFQENDPSRLGVYVGKASMSNIGNRLWAHLYPHRTTNVYRMNDLGGETFILEGLAGIAIRNLRIRALASALEEFIISELQNRVHLLNATGIAR